MSASALVPIYAESLGAHAANTVTLPTLAVLIAHANVAGFWQAV